MSGNITLGQAIKQLRTEVSRLSQEDFARLCNLSRRTLCQIELDCGNPTLQTLNRIFERYDLKLCITPLNSPSDSLAATD